jgi:hypothetical protein
MFGTCVNNNRSECGSNHTPIETFMDVALIKLNSVALVRERTMPTD